MKRHASAFGSARASFGPFEEPFWGCPRKNQLRRTLINVDDSALVALEGCPPLEPAVSRDLAAELNDPALSAAHEFGAIYGQNFDFVWAALSGLSAGAEISVEDAAQDVWLVVARSLPQFRGESSVTTWLFGIARNVVRNHRRLQRRKGCTEAFDESLTLGNEADGGETAEARVALRDIQLFMQTLEESPREVFLCRFLLEMSPREVAAATGLGVLSVYAQTRALKASFKTWHQSQSGNSNETEDQPA